MNRKPFLALNLDRRSRKSLQDQLAIALKAKILDGTIPAGEPLPSSRELATDLHLSRNTVVAACDRLLGEGYLESIPRAGLFVSSQLQGTPNWSSRQSRSEKITDPMRHSAPRSPGTRPLLSHAGLLKDPIPFRPCRPDVSLFPMARWNRHRNHALRIHGNRLLQYQPECTLGYTGLRKSLANYLNESRGVKCDWSQIVVTSGSQQALFLLNQLLINPSDKVMMEEPGYPGAGKAFELMKVKIGRMKIEADGIKVSSRTSRLKLIYSTPSRQFPTGACMSVGRRMELLELANRTGAWLIEDDYDSEFRYSRPPFPSLHSLDQHGRVIYLGTMSKVLCPSLRIGYVVVPHELIEPMEQLKLIVDDYGPLVDQATLALFMESGDFFSHIRRCRKVYGNRLDAFLNEAEKNRLPLTFPHSDGGMNQTGFFLDPQTDSQTVSNNLRSAGFEIPAIDSFRAEPGPAALVFGFSAFDEWTIKNKMPGVAAVLNQNRTRSPR